MMTRTILVLFIVVQVYSLAIASDNKAYLRHQSVLRGGEVVNILNRVDHVICEVCPKRSSLEEVAEAKRITRNQSNIDANIQKTSTGSGTEFINFSSILALQKMQHNEKKLSASEKWDKEETIYFKFNSYKLLTKETYKLNELIASFNPDSHLLKVKGFTCDIGSKKYNDKLAYKRAYAVAKKIEELTKTQPIIESEGLCCYVSKDKKLNRRVEIYKKAKQNY